MGDYLEVKEFKEVIEVKAKCLVNICLMCVIGLISLVMLITNYLTKHLALTSINSINS